MARVVARLHAIRYTLLMGKRCKRCEEIKDSEAFSLQTSAPDSRQSVCRACAALYRQERKARMAWGNSTDGRSLRRKPENEKRARRKVWEEQHRNDLREYMRAYREKRRAELSAQARRYSEDIRSAGITAYGAHCNCCGEQRPEFLTIDHVDGRAVQDFRSSGTRITGKHMWRKLRRLGWPKDAYQLLCFNCNCAKGAYGTCPHEQERRQRHE